MHKNGIWLALLTLVTFITLWFSWGAVRELLAYRKYSGATEATITDWSVVQLNEEAFGVRVAYTYRVDHHLYHGESLLTATKMRNPWAAEEAITQYEKQHWTAWYNPDNLGDATLTRVFPTKSLISALLLWLLTLYFFWLGGYVSRRQQ